MEIIIFGWTTPPLLAGVKTVTRRDWSPTYATRFRKGDRVAAYDRSPRFGGKQIGVIELTDDPYLENTADMPEADYEAEGLAWMEQNMISHFRGIRAMSANDFWDAWRNEAMDMWVVRFRIISLAADNEQ